MAHMAKRKKRASAGLRFLRFLTVFLLIVCLGIGAYLLLADGLPPLKTAGEEEFYLEATFAPGVFVEGIALEGNTLQEAYERLLFKEQSYMAAVEFILEAPQTTFTLTHADMPVAFDTAAVLEAALALGNTGSRSEREEARAALLASPREFSIHYEVDVSAATAKLASLETLVNTAPTDATVEMDMLVEGYFRYTEGIPGETLDMQALLATLQARAQAGEFGFVELPLTYTPPAVHVEDLKRNLTKRGKAETSFKRSPYNREDRVYNVKKAAGLINGFVLKPGEVFSTNDTLGDRTYALGWKPAPAYVRGTTEDQAGGGVCQVSSTLYAAVVKADLEIVYRRNHSSPVSYIDRGLDATINTGTIDFTFKNNTEADVYIFAYTVDSTDGILPEGKDDKTVHVEIFGAGFPDEYDEIRLSAEKLETLYPSKEMEVIVDTTKPATYYEAKVERKNGSIYQSYKHYYKNGVEVKKEPLAKSTYSAWAGQVIVGPGYTPQP